MKFMIVAHRKVVESEVLPAPNDESRKQTSLRLSEDIAGDSPQRDTSNLEGWEAADFLSVRLNSLLVFKWFFVAIHSAVTKIGIQRKQPSQFRVYVTVSDAVSKCAYELVESNSKNF